MNDPLDLTLSEYVRRNQDHLSAWWNRVGDGVYDDWSYFKGKRIGDLSPQLLLCIWGLGKVRLREIAALLVRDGHENEEFARLGRARK